MKPIWMPWNALVILSWTKPLRGLRTKRRAASSCGCTCTIPTLLEAVNVTPPTSIQGQSLISLLRGKSEVGSELYSETYLPRLHFDWSELRGLRRQQYHFIDGPKPELYDLARDPHELQNLY